VSVTLHDLWFGTDATARLGRVALTPLAWLYRGATTARNALFDMGLLPAHATAIPAISVGNLTVGGTGKTPFAAYLVSELLTRGARPCIVLRGYGGDEEQVHRILTPGLRVVVGADRVRAIAEAASQGCDVAVLDDAFQHRHAARVVDMVLVSADVPWSERLLPAGPLRESPRALRRASLLVITCKAASPGRGEELAQRLTRGATPPVAVALLRPHALVPVGRSGEAHSLDALRDRRVLVVAGVGDPKAFVHQLEAVGAHPIPMLFPDHHRYSAADVMGLTARAAGADLVVCTLKDAVKLEALWPDNGPALHYVSQRVELMSGAGHVQAALDRVLAARAPFLSPTAG
jgi:tetraacyldisaccharide 4'-kinase